MSISTRLARALHQALGDEATEDFLALIDAKDSHFAELRADVAELRQETRVGFARVDARFEQIRADWATESGKLRVELEALRTDLVDRVGQRFSHLLLWSFVFWLTSVTTIAFMLKTLR